MILFSEDNIRVDYIWQGTEFGALLRAVHEPTGIAIERTIGMDSHRSTVGL